jgi:6-phosphofructokinase 2
MARPVPAPVSTLTLNPALDVTYEIPHLVADQKVGALKTRFDPGGNGINVGRALKLLDTSATNCCVLAGEIGVLVERLLRDQLDGLQTVQVQGETRINGTILESSPPAQYEVDGGGPRVESEPLEEIFRDFLDGARGGFGVLTGSLPAGVNEEIYSFLVQRLREHQARAVLDSHGRPLELALSQRPFLIKPNRYELEILCGYPLPDLRAVVKEAQRVHEKGVQYVCVSLGAEGAVLVGGKRPLYARAPGVKVNSTVGAGDSLVAGLVAGFARDEEPAEALRLAVACGSGTAEKPGTGLFNPKEVESLLGSIELHPLDT